MQKRDYKKEFKEVYGDYRIPTLPLWLEDREKVYSWFESIIKQERDEVIKEIEKFRATTKPSDSDIEWSLKYRSNLVLDNVIKSLKDKLHSQSK